MAEKKNQVDEIELGLWLMNTMDDWNNDTGIELYQYLAEKLKDKFIITDKPEVIHSDDCDCEQHSKSN